ncbi:MAG: zinc ribbon domain-containing protein [Burkholderiaceae bacterium]
MALIECNKCGKTVPDSAIACPHCSVSAPALTGDGKAELSINLKRALYGKLGGWAFFIGSGWMFFILVTGTDKELVISTWGFVKYLIFGGAAAYFISEIDHNLAERKKNKV